MKITVNGKEIEVKPTWCTVENSKGTCITAELKFIANLESLSSYEREKLEEAIEKRIREE
jgi:hypothetical protein